MLPHLHSDSIPPWLHHQQKKHENRQKRYRLSNSHLILSLSANKDPKPKGSFCSHLWKWSTSRKTRTRLTFRPRSISSLSSSNNMLLTPPSCLTSQKSSYKSFQMHPSSQSIFSVWSKIQKFLFKPKSQFLWLCIFQTENKSQKLVKRSWKRNSKNSEKLEKETIFQRKYWNKFCSRSIKIPFFRKNLAMNSTIYLTIAKTLKKYLRQRFTSISNAIGNILPLSRSQLRSHQQSQSEKLTSWKIWALVQQFQLMSSRLFSVI